MADTKTTLRPTNAVFALEWVARLKTQGYSMKISPEYNSPRRAGPVDTHVNGCPASSVLLDGKIVHVGLFSLTEPTPSYPIWNQQGELL